MISAGLNGFAVLIMLERFKMTGINPDRIQGMNAMVMTVMGGVRVNVKNTRQHKTNGQHQTHDSMGGKPPPRFLLSCIVLTESHRGTIFLTNGSVCESGANICYNF